MSKYVLDSSALLRYIDKEAGYDIVIRVLKESRDGDAELLMSAVNWGEVILVTAKWHGLDAARGLESHLSTMPLQIVAVEASDAKAAALFKHEFGIPYADAFAGSLALRGGAILVTADSDFKALPNDPIRVEFLPGKNPRKARGN